MSPTASRPATTTGGRGARLAVLACALATALLVGACGGSTAGPAVAGGGLTGVPAAGTSVTGLSGAAAPSAPAAPAAPSSVPGGPPPALRVETVVSGLERPWDVTPVGGDRMLVTSRTASLTLVTGTGPGATTRPVAADLSDVYVRGEGGLMGVTALPAAPGDVPGTTTFVTCQTHQAAGRPVDVRLVSWTLSADGSRADRVRDPLLAGLPLNPSGRHSGCRPSVAPDGSLLVGTGDTARATIPQDRTSLGGKVLRIDPRTGGPAPSNPFLGSASAAERLISGYGHRNVQAVAVEPTTGRAWSVEHGPDVDDEVNVVEPGANYGWDPARGGETPGGYDESVPMTDLERFPDAVPAAWSSGDSTEATSGGAFLDGPAWGDLAGTLAVSAQKGAKLLLMRPGIGDRASTIASVAVPVELDDAFGRLRAARLGPDGALYLTTDNGSDDALLRVTRA